jgi:hypothetical protein
MSIFFQLLAARTFHEQIRRALSAAWQQRSFEPCRWLCLALLPAVEVFAQRFHTNPEESLLRQVAAGLPFDRDFWRLLVGEVLLYSAEEIPELQTIPDTFCCLLAPQRYREGPGPRERFAPIEQVHFGARDLFFGGGFYRPDHAGYNNTDEVAQLTNYLDALRPEDWTIAALAGLREVSDDEERADELDFAREWLPPLQELYRRAHQRQQIIVCEIL